MARSRPIAPALALMLACAPLGAALAQQEGTPMRAPLPPQRPFDLDLPGSPSLPPIIVPPPGPAADGPPPDANAPMTSEPDEDQGPEWPQLTPGQKAGAEPAFDPNEKPERPGISTDPGTSIACLPPRLKAVLTQISDKYGAVKVTSTWRPPEMAARLTELLRRLLGCERGGTIVAMGVALPVLAMGAGVVVDYGILSEQRQAFQTVADASALAAAREFRLANATPATVQTAAEKFAKAQLAAVNQTATVATSVDLKKFSVTVDVSTVARTNIMHMFGQDMVTVAASATARVLGTASICVIGLETTKNETIYLEKEAKLEAPECAVYSNSNKTHGLKAMQNSQIRARFICSAGGSYKDKYDSFVPSPTLDCPVLKDPLASRPPPSTGACAATDLKVTSSSTLSPGTYCGGVRISKGAVVTLNPGIYAFKDGKLDVSGGATLKGANVGLYFTGKGAVLRFDADTKIDLTAPRDGVMAGMLVFEDRNSPLNQKHEILSNDAKVLLGTLYLPQGELNIGANKPVAADSAYTIVVARRFTLSAGPTMVMNAKYSSTNIPVPEGVGPGSTAAHLAR